MSESQDSLVSSIAAHSSPRGVTPAALNAASGTRCSVLPIPSRPSAFASRLAGSTVSTSTFEPWVTAAINAEAAAVVVLPTPPGPQATTISLVASRLSREWVGASAEPSLAGRPARGDISRPSSSPRDPATCRVVRSPCDLAKR